MASSNDLNGEEGRGERKKVEEKVKENGKNKRARNTLKANHAILL